MSSALNVTSSTSGAQNQWGQVNNTFQQLSQALSSGNLAAAQQAFATLQQNAPQGASSQNSQAGSSSSTNPMAALGQALQSGNLSAAQQAFSQVQQSAGQHHHHHGGHGSASAASASTETPATTVVAGSTGANVNITA